MLVTAWNNGQHLTSGAGFGFKIQVKDRDRYFQRDWKTAFLELEGYSTPVKVNKGKPSFWGPVCRELISKHIGIWLIDNKLEPWPKGKPPKLIMEHIDGNRFYVHLPDPDDQGL